MGKCSDALVFLEDLEGEMDYLIDLALSSEKDWFEATKEIHELALKIKREIREIAEG